MGLNLRWQIHRLGCRCDCRRLLQSGSKKTISVNLNAIFAAGPRDAEVGQGVFIAKLKRFGQMHAIEQISD